VRRADEHDKTLGRRKRRRRGDEEEEEEEKKKTAGVGDGSC
jgi:hypothetical protein